jgi:S-(hydroxymethyl)glutathione dehydrogenase / alcohol dehydrogenase
MGNKMNFKTAILTELKTPLTLANIFWQNDLKAGQVLVKLLYSGICGSQIGEIDGKKGDDPYIPHLLGHEGTGIVEEIGPGVRFIKPGDHVVLHWKKGNGIDAIPPKYDWRGKTVNAGWVTTFNEYAIISENRLTSIPKDFDSRIGALLGCAVTTGLGVITNNANLKLGESIVVFGAGGVGLNIIQGAELVSAYPIIAIDLFDNRLEMAEKMGATHCINSHNKDCSDQIRAILGTAGADVVIDNTGNTSIIKQAYELTSPVGRTILVGVPYAGDETQLFTLPLHFGKTITGSFGGETNPSIDIPRYIKLYKAGKLKLDQLITDEYPLDEINTAIEKLRNGEITGRCLIKMNQ